MFELAAASYQTSNYYVAACVNSVEIMLRCCIEVAMSITAAAHEIVRMKAIIMLKSVSFLLTRHEIFELNT